MDASRATKWVFALALAGGCASPERPDFIGGAAVTAAKWFCEMSKDGGWHCVQDPKQIANPQPSRFPQPVATQRGQSERSLPNVAPVPPPPPPFSPAPEQPPVPLYQQLAYQPEDPVALVDLPEAFYAIQLVALRSQTDLEAFVVDHGLPPMSGAQVEKDGGLWFVLLAGVYEDLDTAQRALASLPENLKVMNPWLRPMASLRNAILRAENLTP